MPKTILLADDSVTIQKVVGISFANEDVVLLTVDNGDDAVVRAREARPDLVLADVMMPGKDGYDVCETLKADPDLRHVPVLLLSGTFEPYDEERAERAGADGHITKPFEAQALVDQVNALLSRSEAPAATADPEASDATIVVANPADGDPDAAFDFFDEEMARTAPSPSGSLPPLLDDDDDGALELEAAVDEDDGIAALSSPDREPFAAPTAGDSQPTALLMEPEPPATSQSGRFRPDFGAEDADDVPFTPPQSESGAITAVGRPHDYEETFDFGFHEDARDAELAAPTGERAEEAPFAPVASPPGLPDDSFGVPHATGLTVTDPRPEAPAPPPVPAPVAEPSVPPFPSAMPPPVPPAATASETPVAVHVAGAVRSPALSEPIQKQLQETLEKIVWEAFGDVTERIVRDVIERVEAVAWEVIPQMTETLIREEIRRLQDDSEES